MHMHMYIYNALTCTCGVLKVRSRALSELDGEELVAAGSKACSESEGGGFVPAVLPSSISNLSVGCIHTSQFHAYVGNVTCVNSITCTYLFVIVLGCLSSGAWSALCRFSNVLFFW